MPVTWRTERYPIPAPAVIPPATRRWNPGHYVALSDAQMGTQPSNYNPGGIPNPGKRWNTGPVATGIRALVIPYHWCEIDDGSGTYNWTRLDSEIAQAGGFPADADGTKGVQYIIKFVTRTFTGFNLATPYTLSNVQITGTAGQFSCNAASKTISAANYVMGISGTLTGSGGITGFNGSQRYSISATNGSTTFTLQTLDGNAISTKVGTTTGLTFIVCDIENPLPLDLQYPKMYAETFSAATLGWQVWRWSPTVLSRFNDVCTAIGARYDKNAYFGGIATQETSTSGASGGTGADAYTASNYVAGLQSEAKTINSTNPSSYGFHYTNFIPGPYQSPITSEQVGLQTYATTVQANGGVWGGPDLVVDGIVVTRCYPTYGLVVNGTSPIGGKGPTFCSVQQAEWTQTSPADPSNPQTVQALYNWGTGVKGNYGNGGPQTPPLNLDIIVWDWHTTAGYNGQKFTPDGTTIFANNPAPFGPFTP